MSPRQSGFTLVELVVVIIVVGILAMTVFPRMDLLRGYDEAGYRDKVRSTLAFARTSAVAQRRNVRVALVGNNLALSIDNDVPEGANAGAYPRPLNLPATDSRCSGSANMICAPSGVTLIGANALTFVPLGRLSGVANAAYTVTGQTAYTVTVEAETGYVR